MRDELFNDPPSEELEDLPLTNKQFLDASAQFIRREDIKSFNVVDKTVSGLDSTVYHN
jgi:hypothetical protein